MSLGKFRVKKLVGDGPDHPKTQAAQLQHGYSNIYDMVILSGFIKQDSIQFSYKAQSFINGDSFYY